jgi:hypothetical protein
LATGQTKVKVATERGVWVPEVSRFLGVVVAIYYNDHPPPHFHAKYGDRRAAFSMDDLRLLEGGLPPRVTALVLEWAFAHRTELFEDWRRAVARKPLKSIAPLE